MKYTLVLLTLFTVLSGLNCKSNKLIMIDNTQLEISILIDECLALSPTDIFFEFKNLTGEKIIVNANAIYFQGISDHTGSKIKSKYHFEDIRIQEQQFYSIERGNSIQIPYNLNILKLFEFDLTKKYKFNFTYDNQIRKMKRGGRLLVGKIDIPVTSFTICN